jgi:hypothetical protein
MRVLSDISLNYSSLATFMLSGALLQQPAATIFNATDASGRRLGDVNNDGAYNSADASAVAVYAAGSQSNADIVSYIEDVLTPGLLALYNDYEEVKALYNPSLADWRVGIMRLDAVPGGRR